MGTCSEHGHGFELTSFEENFPLGQTNEMNPDSEEFAESDIESSADEFEPEYSTEFANSIPETMEVSDWSDGDEWSEDGEWPSDNDLKPSELNHDVIKNYMSYFLKENPSSHSRAPSQRDDLSTSTRQDTKKSNEMPMIVHGPDFYVPPTQKKSNRQKHETRFHKKDVIFDRDKQDRILRRRRY